MTTSSKRIDNRVRLHTLIECEVIVDPLTGAAEVRFDEVSKRNAIREAMTEAQRQAGAVHTLSAWNCQEPWDGPTYSASSGITCHHEDCAR